MNNKKNPDMKNNIKNKQDTINSNSNNNLQTLSSHSDRKNDTLPFRLEFIQKLLGGKKLDPMINFDDISTENFVHPNGYHCLKDMTNKDNKINSNNKNDDNTGTASTSSNETTSSYDTRVILNKNIHDFYKVINEIGGKLLYVKSGTTGHTFKGIVNPESGININYAVKVVAYPKKEKYGEMNDIRRPENAELMMIRLLSYFVVKKQTPHIVLPIGTFYSSIKPFVRLIEDSVVDRENKKYAEFVERYNKNEYYDEVSILISEWANRGDLLDFMRKNYKEFKLVHWKVFFFQFISVLAVIQSKFPTFRHNDLKANNVLVHKINQRGTMFSYVVAKKKYIIPNIGYIVKLWDFDFACIPGIVENAKVSAKWTDDINVKPVQNRYYDMHYFFNTLIKKGFFPELLEDEGIPKEVKDFINRIVPHKFQYGELVTKRGRILVDDEYLLPENVLANDVFFEEFRNYKLKKDKSSSTHHSSQHASQHPSQHPSQHTSQPYNSNNHLTLNNTTLTTPLNVKSGKRYMLSATDK